MNKQKLVDLFKDPTPIAEKELKEVEQIVKENPYFQSAYALIAVGKKLLEPRSSGTDIARAAIYATNRVNLKKYLDVKNGGAQAPAAPTAKKEVKEAIKKEDKTPQKVPLKASQEKPTPQKPKVEAAKAVPQKTKTEDVKAAPQIKKLVKSKEELAKKPVVKKEEVEDPTPVKTTTHPRDLNYDEILESLKTEYQLLEVNMKNFDLAEKSLSASEKEETKSSAKKTSTARSSTRKSTSTKKKTTSTTATAKKAAPKKTAASSTKKPTTSAAKKTTNTAKKTSAKSTSRSTSKTTKKTGAKNEDDGNSDPEAKKKEQDKLIDNFIKAEPKITPKKEPSADSPQLEDLASKNQEITDDMVTETLAGIMIKQGRVEKAIEIYNKLIWKFPHKKAYFAGRIKELREQ